MKTVLKENTFVTRLRQQINSYRAHLRYVTKNPQLYYYLYGNCIYEREYNNENYFKLTNSEVEMSYSEKELVAKGAKKTYYEKEIT